MTHILYQGTLPSADVPVKSGEAMFRVCFALFIFTPLLSVCVADAGTVKSKAVSIQVLSSSINQVGPVWVEIPNTLISSVCPPNYRELLPGAPSNCGAIIDAWGGAAADIKRNRLMLWGGGHGDYWGNEMYAYDLQTQKLTRLNEPSAHPAMDDTNNSVMPDGRPTSRHTYNGLEFLPEQDELYVFGGSIADSGGMQKESWVLKLGPFYTNPNSSAPWTKVATTTPYDHYYNLPAVSFDPVSKLLYAFDSSGGLFSYNPASKQMSPFTNLGPPGIHFSSVVDPDGRFFYLFGEGKVHRVNLNTPGASFNDVTSLYANCSALFTDVYPGVTYDTKNKRIVGWSGDRRVYFFSADKCTTLDVPGVNPGLTVNKKLNGLGGGVHSRFRYFPALNYFVLLNRPDQNIFVLKLE